MGPKGRVAAIPASFIDARNESQPVKKKKKKRVKRAVYEQYLADSGSDRSSDDEVAEDCSYEREEYSVGMDINILIQQTVQNLVQSVCLEDVDSLSDFGDHELVCFAAAVKHNTSILSLQIRDLNVSDVSLVPLCEALKIHPSIRALDLSGTQGGHATSRALRELVCANPNIIFMKLDETIASVHDADIIQEATQYNAMVCPDPNNNPFHLGLLRKISAMEQEEQRFHEQLQARPWLFGDESQLAVNETAEKGTNKKRKKVTVAPSATSRIGGDVCAQFIQGRCVYGSRCKYIHPDRTSALNNAIASTQYERAEMLGGEDGRSSVFSAATSASRHRLQSRLRPSRFTFQASRARGAVEKETEPSVSPSPGPSVADGERRGEAAPLWILCGSVVGCCAALAALF